MWKYSKTQYILKFNTHVILRGKRSFFDNKLIRLFRQQMRWFFVEKAGEKEVKQNKKHWEFKFWERGKKKMKRISERLYVHEMLIG